MEKIEIYAPISGVIKSITECEDETFSSKILGDGFLVEPSSNEVHSIFDESSIEMLFETKHAFFIKSIYGPKALIHIGIDTVKLNGQPFEYFKEINNISNVNELILKVDYDLIAKNKLSKQTMICFDNDESVNFQLNKSGEVKQGELIGYLFLKKTDSNKTELQKESKFLTSAKEIIKLVGSKTNFTSYYNCMTRLRFIINDKNNVSEEKIKKLSIVKGINWSGQELQIIIGGDVYKVKEEIDKIIPEDTNIKIKAVKKGFKDKALGFISGVIVPTIPIILAAGILMAIKSLLIQFNVIDDIKNYDQMRNAKLFSAFIYIISEVGIGMLGIFLCISTVKYLKGNIIVGALIGVAIASPYLMWGINYTLFDWGFIKIKLGGYYNSIIPQIVAGSLYVYVDKWVKSWMPTSIDICFRTAISFGIVMTSIMFILGPILGVVEGLVGVAVKWLGDIPYGIGTMLFALLWQPLVLTGVHVPIIMAVIQNLPSPLYAASVFGVFGQLGAVICIGNWTNNFKTKEIAYSAIPSAIVGITEPIIYGITLPKFTPFIAGSLGAGLAGLITGLLNINASVAGGMGLLGVTRFIPGGAYQIGIFFLGSFISIFASYVFTFLMYKERHNENFLILKTNKTLVKFIKINNILSEKEIDKLLNNINQNFKFSKQEKLEIKRIEKMLSLNSKIESKIINLLDKQNEMIVKFEMQKNKYHINQNLDKLNIVEEKINKLKNNNKILKLENKKNEFLKNYKEALKSLEFLQNNLLSKIERELKKIFTINNNTNKIMNNYYNSIHSLDIHFELNERKEDLLYINRKRNKNEVS
ncbi:PTS system, beta-glucosides-specific IIC component [Spiroplasma litorale]|uniref:PTS system, beta-glucosides-specific IIC component n=1 Tax=Spiroplasma litorale TaxID=216942 RepID=A0A0K1W206_9MOLU|nr:PTS glucose transporter subunit IIABC [Spiroplasma litorale]AKX34216.1 PTS system, beta-glucosides-specific IIC component [Spiroplasma litorale]